MMSLRNFIGEKGPTEARAKIPDLIGPLLEG